MSTTVFQLCNHAISLVRGKRLILEGAERSLLEVLDYEGLADVQAQDEAVICAMNFERVRDRLLQSYAWVFARKHNTLLHSAVYMSDCLAVLAVLKEGKPLEYEQGNIPEEADEVIYTRRVSNVNDWPPVFCDVFTYSLAVEICPAVTGRPEYAQALEQKVQELLHRACQIGAIRAETRLTFSEELYNRAIGLARGTRTLKETSTAATEQGIDNAGFVNDRMTAEYQACVRASERVRDRLLSLYAWRFARKSAALSTLAVAVSGWAYSYLLPEDCIRLLAVVNEDGEYEDYEELNGAVSSNAENLTVRYTALKDDPEKWPGIFADVYCYLLAEEVVLSTTGNAETIQLLEGKAQQLIREAERIGEIRAEERLPAQEELYNRVIGLVRGTRTVKETSTAGTEQGLDTSGARNERYQAEYQACKRAYESVRDRLLALYAWTFARKSVSLSSKTILNNGWSAGYKLPIDCVRVLNVLEEDGTPVDFEEVDGYVCCIIDNPTVRYTARITDPEEWAGVFTDVFCYTLAQEVVMSTTGDAGQLQLLEAKAQSLVKDAHRLGEIRAEVKIPASIELYNRAIALVRGQRIVSPSGSTSVEQGADFTGDVNYREREALAVCRRSMPMLRDKILSQYAWKFARQTARLTYSEHVSGWVNAYALPEGCMRVLAVLSDEEPVEYEESDGQILSNAGGNMYVRYTRKVEELEELSSEFSEILCLELAIEVSNALTWNAEQVALLEQQKQQVIQNAYRTGAIQEETRIPLKEELYNRSIRLSRGTRTLKTSGESATVQGVDNYSYQNDRTDAEIGACKRASESVRDKLLQLYPWVFARKSAELSQQAGISGWDYAYELPSDCLTVLAVLSENEPVDFEVIGGMVYSNGAGACVRYTSSVKDIKDWPSGFRDAYCYELAEEIVHATTGNNEQIIFLEQKKQLLIQDAYKTGVIKTETRIAAKYELYNRAIGLVKGLKTEKADTLDTRYEDELSACRRGHDNIRDMLLQSYAWIFARKTETPAPLSANTPGWRYTYLLPEDCLKVNAVIGNDPRAEWGESYECNCRNMSGYSDTVELTNWEAAGRELYANRDVVYVRYTSRIIDSKDWAAAFTEAFVILLAIEVALNVVGDKNIIAILEQRLARLIEEARQNGLIMEETKLPRQRESQRIGNVGRQYLDYSGIPTWPCWPENKYCERGIFGEGNAGKFCEWRDSTHTSC